MNEPKGLTGRDLVSRIERLVRHQSRLAQVEAFENSMKELQTELDGNLISLDAKGLVEDLERNRRALLLSAVREYFQERLMDVFLHSKLPHLSAPEITEVAEKLASIYGKGRWGNGSKRVLSSQITSALRCYKQRYLLSWQEIYEQNFDAASFRDEVMALADKFISNPEDLDAWAEETYKLTNRYGVDRGNLLESMKTTRSSRPLGIISEGSVGPYSRQWMSWIRSNAQTLLSVDFNNQPGMRVVVGNDYLWNRQPVTPAAGRIHSQKSSSSQKLAISLTAENDATLTAKSEWSSLAEGVAALPKWLALVESMWRGRAQKVTATLSLKSEVNNFDIDLPASEFEPTKSALIEAVKSISQ